MSAGHARAMSRYCAEADAEIERLTGFAPRIEWSADAQQYGVWLVCDIDGDEDLIGSGDSEDEALEDALDTVIGWTAASAQEAIAEIAARFARCMAGVAPGTVLP